ncbi:MAG TPA: M23 family metallopeptidase [Ilumatobacter sp.]|nr:M23 family metallopeptidase [Ilumatobacter sp.]
MVLLLGAVVMIPASLAAGFGSALTDPARASTPADRIWDTTSGLLRFPIDPVPMCEFLNNYREPARPGHVGVDIGASRGQEVYAVADGVLYDQWLDTGAAGFGWGLESDTEVRYRYFHLDSFAPDLEVGDRVDSGQLIGYVGTTGNAHPDGPHLHFEVRPNGESRTRAYDTTVDPAPLLAIPSVCNIYGTIRQPTPSTTTTTTTSTTLSPVVTTGSTT